MTIVFRIVLIAVAVLSLLYMMRKIHQSKLQIEHSLFWVIFSIIILIIAIFPQLPIWLAKLLGIQSPVNLVYLIIIFVLIIRLFQVTLQMSKLENRLKNFVQHEAIREHEEDSKSKNLEKNGSNDN